MIALKTYFKPECLTIYLSNICNLDCIYCYSKNKEVKEPILRIEDIKIAAKLVAQNCAEKGINFTLVFHGGGEPTIHLPLIKKIFKQIYIILEEYSLSCFSYIATNGIMPVESAVWVAENFNSIGISCDGPPDIQNKQRASKGNKKSSNLLFQTIEILNQKKVNFSLRATITPQTFKRQEEIVTYFINVFKADIIRFEPVYGEFSKNIFEESQAEEFVKNFLIAKKKAESMGTDLSLSSVRPEEIHGPFCNILKNVLQLSPAGFASACFLHSPDNADNFFTIGAVNRDKEIFEFDEEKIRFFKEKALKIPIECKGCINEYHCARNCPDFCYLQDKYMENKHFRCDILKLLSSFLIE